MSNPAAAEAERIRRRIRVRVLLGLVAVGVVPVGEAEGQVSHASTVLTAGAPRGPAVTLRVNRLGERRRVKPVEPATGNRLRRPLLWAA